MKKVFGILALAGLVGGTLALLQVTTGAMPPPPSTVVKIVCDGNNSCCMGTGPTNYFYHVNFPSGGAVQVSRIDIGTDDPDITHYSGWIEPPGWSHQIIAAPAGWQHRPGCKVHGVTTTPVGDCPFIIRWTPTPPTPPATSSFTLGFDISRAAHETTWKSSVFGNQANWSKPIGLGEGPVHSPQLNTPPHQQGQHDI